LAFFIFRAVQRLSAKEGLRSDSSLAITLVSLFSLGVVLLQTLAHNVDLDLDCVLFGELGLLSLENAWINIGDVGITSSVVISFFLFLLSALLTWCQQRSYAFLTFDKSNSQLHRIKESRLLRLLALWLALVVAHSFEKAGVVLVLGMLTLPAAILHVLGRTWTQMLWLMIPLVAGISYLAVKLGQHFDLNVSALWVQSAFVIFMLSWVGKILMGRGPQAT
jgi:manganese/zinc/iron transport system permease protein